ncbi:hypothetical protein BGZ83_010136 [Gryganskiella cystojenkinii]|nr:hypothetical protein BGZ83_010136 [Gryganskiella cystojenkinii]
MDQRQRIPTTVPLRQPGPELGPGHRLGPESIPGATAPRLGTVVDARPPPCMRGSFLDNGEPLPPGVQTHSISAINGRIVTPPHVGTSISSFITTLAPVVTIITIESRSLVIDNNLDVKRSKVYISSYLINAASELNPAPTSALSSPWRCCRMRIDVTATIREPFSITTNTASIAAGPFPETANRTVAEAIPNSCHYKGIGAVL